MERRRRALGVKKPGSIKEGSLKQNEIDPGETPRPKSTENNIAKVKTSHKSQSKGSVTPKHVTPHHQNNATPVRSESPCSPLQSSNNRMMFPSFLGSPEIEVSWDWSCSQVPKDMLPPKQVKRVNRVKPQLPEIPPINIYPRLPPQHQLTEEENQQRLEFYKNILSNALKSDSDVSSDSTNNNQKLNSPDTSKIFTTPKRYSSLSLSTKKKDEQVNSLFDDSANELMFECSQAIEEQLQRGEIDMGPLVDIKILKTKRPISPAEEGKSEFHKRKCHGRVNLFPEDLTNQNMIDEDNVTKHVFDPSTLPQLTTNGINRPELNQDCDRMVGHGRRVEDSSINATFVNINTSNKTFETQTCSSDNPPHSKIEVNALQTLNNNNNLDEKSFVNTNVYNIERKPLAAKPVHPVGNPGRSSKLIAPHSSVAVVFKNNETVSTYSGVDKFCKPNVVCNNNQNHKNNNNIINNHANLVNGQNSTICQANGTQRPNINSTTQGQSYITKDLDVASLLEDDFDMELSCLDVDSLCRSSENIKPQNLSVTHSAPKQCTQEEIEAKRLAALQKLMMKRKGVF